MKIFGYNFGDTPTPLPPKNTSEYMGSFSYQNVDDLFRNDENLSRPYISDYNPNAWVYFGSDNLYPQQLVNMYLTSSFHSSVIEFKTSLLLKDELIFTDSENTLENKIKKEKIKKLYSKDFLYSFFTDFIINKRIHINIKNNLPTIIDAEKVRYNKDKSIYYVNEDWLQNRANQIEKITSYDPKKGGMLSYMRLTKGVRYYPVPDYISAVNWIFLDANLSYFQKQNIVQSINPSATLTIFEDFDDIDEEKAFMNGLKRDFEGSKNAGKVMVFKADPNQPDLAPKLVMQESNKLDKAFTNVQDTIIRNIAHAHTIPPVLLGVATGGKLGASQEIIDSFAIFKASTLKPLMECLEEYLTNLANELGYKGKITFNKEINLI